MVINIKNLGIIIRNFDENNKKFIGTRRDLFEIFYKYNVNIIAIPISNNFEKIKELIKLCDGIILSGGDNFLETDFLLIDYLYKNNIPVLGICLGMQGMCRYLSGEIETNVDNHLSEEKYVHHINIEKDSLLYKIIGEDRILVNSRHRSAIVNTNLKISALSDDGIIEAIEDTSKKFYVGVEWHPESINDEYTKRLFDYFVNII